MIYELTWGISVVWKKKIARLMVINLTRAVMYVLIIVDRRRFAMIQHMTLLQHGPPQEKIVRLRAEKPGWLADLNIRSTPSKDCENQILTVIAGYVCAANFGTPAHCTLGIFLYAH